VEWWTLIFAGVAAVAGLWVVWLMVAARHTTIKVKDLRAD
jgi:hypothetical protein